MRLVFLIVIAILSLPVYSQSRRVAPATTPAPTVGTELTVTQMFDEANTYHWISKRGRARVCRTCQRQAVARYAAKKKAVMSA